MELIPAIYYQFIYLFVTSLLTFFILNKISRINGSWDNNICTHKNKSVAWLFVAVSIGLFIGLRPESHVFVDMVGTAAFWFNRIEATTQGLEAQNFIYDHIPYYIDMLGGSTRTFFVVMSLFYFVGTGYACKRIFGEHVLIAFVVWLAAFSTFSYATNGVKAGAAATWFLIALSFYRNKVISFIMLFITLGFHHSMTLPIGAYLLCLYIKKPKYYMCFWLLSLLFSFAHITSIMEWIGNFIAGGGDEHGADYLLGGQEDVIKKGFRIDFIIYSAAPVLIGYWVIFKKKVQSEYYNFLWSVYVVCNSFWMICMYASFTNRIAYLSWLMYPLVLIYPFLEENFMDNQATLLKRIVMLHFAFTAFMVLIYY